MVNLDDRLYGAVDVAVALTIDAVIALAVDVIADLVVDVAVVRAEECLMIVTTVVAVDSNDADLNMDLASLNADCGVALVDVAFVSMVHSLHNAVDLYLNSLAGR